MNGTNGLRPWPGVAAIFAMIALLALPVGGGAPPRAASDGWVCPMRCLPESAGPGKCADCGMRMVLASSLPPPHPPESAPPVVAAYVCSRGDGTEDVAAGRCGRCGAELVRVNRPLTAAVLIFDGVQIIDYTGPMEVFGQGRVPPVTVAKTTDTITTNMGMTVVPSHSFADCPPADVLIIPGGGVDRVVGDAAAIRWVRERAGKAQFVLTVCNGAFILAETGLLDGLSATTFYGLLDDFEATYPKVKAVRDRRYVDNGKFVTTAGISSGIDGSLYVIGKLRGRAWAERAALNMEYDWKPGGTYARAAFADRHLTRIFDDNFRLRIVEGVAPLLDHTRGDARRWEAEWRLAPTPLAAGELLKRLDRTVAERGPWTRDGAADASTGRVPLVRSAWRFDDKGVRWKGTTEIEAEPGDRYRVRVRIERV